MSSGSLPDPALYPFTSRWFNTSAGRMHYVDEGTGPVILLCHGNPMWSFLYRNIIISLRDRFRCVAADLHGFGLSDRPAGFDYTAESHVRALGELVDHLELDDFLIMGQDWGGPTGLGVAIERHERVRGVVLGNTFFWPGERVLRVFSRFASSPPLQHLIIKRNAFVTVGVPSATARNLSKDEMRHYIGVQADPTARVGIAAFPAQIRTAPLLRALERDVPALLGDKPALIVWGMKDFGFRARERDRIRAVFRDHDYLELPDAAHYIQEDAPDQIAEAIKRRFP